MPRRHDIDALRVLAFALVILYHLGMFYVAGWPWHLKSAEPQAWLQVPMRALNLWRMDLVFFVSGVALSILARGTRPGALLRQRSVRLLLPLVFGMAVLVPYQAYAQAVANGSVAPGFGAFLARYVTGGPWPRGAFDGAEFGVTWNHLWYLPYLWCYTAVVLIAAPLVGTAIACRLRSAFVGARGWRLVAAGALPLMAASLLLRPHFPPTHDLIHDAWLHAVSLTVFLAGYAVGTDAGWWSEAMRLRRRLLAAAACCWSVILLLPLPAPDAAAWRPLLRVLGDLYAWCVIVAVLGFAHRHLNRPWRWLPWAGEQVYPWYLLHQTLIIALAVQLAPWRLPAGAEALLLLAGTVAGCWGLTAIVRRVRWLRPLFGLKPPARPRHPSPGRPVHPGAHSA